MVAAVTVAVGKDTQGIAQRWPGELVQRVVRLDEGADGFPRSWIMLFPVGRFTHPEYGKLNFTRSRLARIKTLFDRRVRHIDIALDADHAAARGDTRATGWIESLELRDPAGGDAQQAGLWGLIRWTPYGARLLKDQEYRYFSPEFGPWTDPENGEKYDDVLIGGGLTNRPFLKCMEAIALAGDGGTGGVSRTPWSSIKKSCLPRSSFLIQGDPDDKSTWKLPVYEGAGEKDAQGHYTRRGPLNINGVRAALDAIGGARTGKAMNVPGSVRSRLEGWMKRYGAGAGAERDGDSSDGGDKAASEVGMATGTKYTPGGEGTRTTRRREAQSGAIDERAARAWLEGQRVQRLNAADRALREQDEDADEAATEDPDELYTLGGDDEGDYELADGADGDGSDGFDKMSDTHGPMTCADHTHGKYAGHSHDGDADHSEAPLKDDGDDGEEMAEDTNPDGEEYAEPDEEPDYGDEEDDGAGQEGTSGSRGEDAGGKQSPKMGGKRTGANDNGTGPTKRSMPKSNRGSSPTTATRKASEGSQQGSQRRMQGGRVGNGDQGGSMTLAEQRALQDKVKRLEESHAEMAYQLYETEVGKTLSGWQAQTFQFKEGTRADKDGKQVPVYRQGQIALSKVFREQYRGFMLHEGLRMGSAVRRKLNELLESAFTGVVDLTARGGSFDQEGRLTRKAGNSRRPATAESSDALQQAAERLAQQRGKTLSEISSETELFAIYEEAERLVGYH